MERSYARRIDAREIREEAAELAFRRPHALNESNGEEFAYASFVANYTKGLPHNNIGEVLPTAYRALLRAVMSGDPADFDAIPLAELDPPTQRQRRLTNPQAGAAFTLEAQDAQALMLPPSGRIDGPQMAAEMAELYWMALLRDVSFTEYGTGVNTDAGPPTTTDAANSLSSDFTDFPGSVPVTPQTLFRGTQPGCRTGPYVSQFLIKDIPFGSFRFVQRQQPPVGQQPGQPPGGAPRNYILDHPTWLNIQNGAQPDLAIELECDPATGQPVQRHFRNLRDLTHLVHFDVSFQHYFNACLLLQWMGRSPEQLPADPCHTSVDGPPCMSGPIDLGNPYRDSRNQEGFGTFGNWHIPTLLAEVVTRALKAMWFQKWFVHRRLRPEALGGLIHIHLEGLPAVAGNPYPHPAIAAGRYPMINNEILASLSPGGALHPFFGPGGGAPSRFFLPQAFPEGSPMHPSYGEGHAVVAGACVTILKAFYAGSHRFDPASPNPFNQPEEPTADGLALQPYGGTLTVTGELNKLALNIGLGGRCGAGVHYRSDNDESLRLGETIAIGLLQEQMRTYNEVRPNGPNGIRPSFDISKFDGSVVRIQYDGTIVGV